MYIHTLTETVTGSAGKINDDSNVSALLMCNKTSHLHFMSHLPTHFLSALSSKATRDEAESKQMFVV